jgi:hypothetical protein
MCNQQCSIVGFGERTAAGEIGGVRYRERRINRFDATDEIVVLRRSREDYDLGLAEREKDTARGLAERLHGRRGIRHLDPAVVGERRPGRAAEREQRDACGDRRRGCIGRNDRGVRMRRVDESIDAFGCEISRKALGAAESADAHRHPLRGRRGGAPRERDRYGHVRACAEALRQPSRLRGTAENKDALHVVR